MTKKNARKMAARARQEKTGQKYQSALRAEGGSARHVIIEFLSWVRKNGVREGYPMTYTDNELLNFLELRLAGFIGHRDHKPDNSPMSKEERDDLVARAITEMGPKEFWKRVNDARLVNDAASPPLRGWGLEVPLEPLPKDVLDKKHVYEKFYATDPTPTVKENIDPQKLWDYWKDIPEAKRCTDSKRLRMGVTDDHPEKPLVTWTSLARTKDCPGFGEWWHSLPESSVYDRSKPMIPPIPTSAIFRAQYPGQPLPPGMQDKPWTTDTMTPGPTGKVRIIVEEKHPTAGNTQHNRHTLIMPKVGNDEAMFEAIGARVKEERPSWTGWCFVSCEPV